MVWTWTRGYGLLTPVLDKQNTLLEKTNMWIFLPCTEEHRHGREIGNDVSYGELS